ncbi:putative integral membrane protein conserved region-domain-containing protein, partial [Phycomyces blakesleeanus]
MTFLTLLGIYVFGGLTFLPLLAILIYVTHATEKLTVDPPPPKPVTKDVYGQRGNQGWIRLTTRYKPKDAESSGLLAGIQAAYLGPLNRRSKGLVVAYGVLKHGALFLYEGSDQQELRLILPMHDYRVSLYPENKSESELFGRHTAIRLKISPTTTSPSKHTTIAQKDTHEVDYSYLLNTDLYLMCARPVDKEDWLLALTSASEMMAESPDKAHIETVDQTHFDPPAMQALIGTVHQDANHYEIQWLNAIMGRLFLGIYRTESLKKYCQDTFTTKSKKAHLPHFLGDLHVKSVDVGKSIPYITRPRLLSLSPEGDLLAEAHVEYTGGLCVVVETDLSVSYSSLMKPLRVRLVLSVQLKRFVGKFNIKIKPPPSNRFWLGFCETPEMTWAITPEVSDKQIKLAMVTNAIESKIRDFIVETMVLPNMEDFPFCSSGGRGGVFGERIPKPSMS